MKRTGLLILSSFVLIIIAWASYAAMYYIEPGDTIQQAIDMASGGDTIVVTMGIYYENLHFHGKNIALMGTDPDNFAVTASTIIDGSQPDNPHPTSVITFSGSETKACVIAGLTIRNGTGTIDGAGRRSGGGLYGNQTQATIRNNIITDNHVNWNGGGAIDCNGLIEHNVFLDNSAGSYGGGLVWCDGTIKSNVISSNTSGTFGGGLGDCDGVISENVICGNSSEYAGGGADGCDGTIQHNIISGNATLMGGGAVWSNGTFRNNTFACNSAEAVGGGMAGCGGTITNCIIWENSADTGPQFYNGNMPTYSCIQEWTEGGEGNISTDPMFVDVPDSTGFWTDNAVYDTTTFQTTLTNANTLWDSGTLAGTFLNPNTAQYLQFYIVANTDTTITVWADASALGIAGNQYQIYDYHLQENSPCIDVGYMFANVGEYDLDGNLRYLDASDTSGWDGTIKGITATDGDTVLIAWKLIDMGAYEYQPVGDFYDTFTVQAIDRLDTGAWQDVFTGNAGTWIDTSTAETEKRYYRVIGN